MHTHTLTALTANLKMMRIRSIGGFVFIAGIVFQIQSIKYGIHVWLVDISVALNMFVI